MLRNTPDQLLVSRFRSGDENALRELARRYRGLVKAKARRYFVAGGDAQDLEQEALIGLYKAARDYQPQREVSFSAFANVCVTRQVLSAVRSAGRLKHGPLNDSMSTAVPLFADDDQLELEWEDPQQSDPAEQFEDREELQLVREAVEELLSDEEQQVVALYASGKSYDEIAEALGRGSKWVDNALQRVKRKLTGAIQPDDDQAA